MDQHKPKRKSLRKNLRSNYKSMLDPYNDNKYDVSKENGSILTSLGLRQSKKSEDTLPKENIDENSSTKECLFPSYSNKSYKSPKSCAIKVPSKSLQKIVTRSTITETSVKKSENKDTKALSDNKVEGNYSVSEKKSILEKDEIIKLKSSDDDQQPVQKSQSSGDDFKLQNTNVQTKDLSKNSSSYKKNQRIISDSRKENSSTELGHSFNSQHEHSSQKSNSNYENCPPLLNGDENSTKFQPLNLCEIKEKISIIQQFGTQVTYKKSSTTTTPIKKPAAVDAIKPILKGSASSETGDVSNTAANLHKISQHSFEEDHIAKPLCKERLTEKDSSLDNAKKSRKSQAVKQKSPDEKTMTGTRRNRRRITNENIADKLINNEEAIHTSKKPRKIKTPHQLIESSPNNKIAPSPESYTVDKTTNKRKSRSSLQSSSPIKKISTSVPKKAKDEVSKSPIKNKKSPERKQATKTLKDSTARKKPIKKDNNKTPQVSITTEITDVNDGKIKKRRKKSAVSQATENKSNSCTLIVDGDALDSSVMTTKASINFKKNSHMNSFEASPEFISPAPKKVVAKGSVDPEEKESSLQVINQSKTKKKKSIKASQSHQNKPGEMSAAHRKMVELYSDLNNKSAKDMPVIGTAHKHHVPENKEKTPIQHEQVQEDPKLLKKLTRGPTARKKRGRKRKVDENKSKKIRQDEDMTEVSLEPPKKERKKSQRRTGRRFSVTGNWYIAAGFLNDVISLLEDFDAINGWRFMDFAQCWRKKNFSLVYRGRQTFKELLEFSEEITLLTKRFLSPPHSVKRRIGALYTLYGLYHKFPLGRRHFFFLRFELPEYKMLLELIHPFRSNLENPDPAFIFRKLELEGAILHCATACEPCYDFHNEEREYVELEYGKQRLAKSSAVTNALPKVQLQADEEILLHYHSIKSRLAGNKDKPEKVLSMITPEFLSGIASNLMQLRQDTRQELGMLEENSMNRDIKDEDVVAKLSDYDPSRDEVEEMLETVNNGASGMRSRHALENNEMTKDSTIRDFMRPPTSEDLQKPLRMQTKSGRIGKRGRPKVKKGLSAVFNTELDHGRVHLDIESEPPVDQELREVLLPQPMPQKKKRGRKRAAALLQAATYPIRRGRPRKPPAIVKTLTNDNSDLETDTASVPALESATRLFAAELPAPQQDPTTIVKVRLRAGAIQKTVKLKVKITIESFHAMRKNDTRYANFKEKLKPLIKKTLPDENKHKEWTVESVYLPEEEDKDGEDGYKIDDEEDIKDLVREETRPSPSVPSPLKKTNLSLKERYECLKYDDDDGDDDDEEKYDPDDDLSRKTSWKTEEEKDTEYAPPDEEPEEDPYELEDIDNDIEDDDWVGEEPQRFWRTTKRGRRIRWDGTYEERGPRDSDQLLQLRTEKSVAMVPVQVDGSLRYFPMIKTKEQAQLPSVPESGLFTWNDFSSEKEPPFKKRRRSTNEAFPYLFSMRRPKDASESPKKNRSRDLPPPKVKKIKIDLPDIPPENNILFLDEEENFSSVSVKKEGQTVLEELAVDWEEECSSTVDFPTRCAVKEDEKNVNEEPDSTVGYKTEQALDNSIDHVSSPEPDNVSSHTAVGEDLDPLVTYSPETRASQTNTLFNLSESSTDGTSVIPQVSEGLPNFSAPVSIPFGSNVQVIPVQVDKNISSTGTPISEDVSNQPLGAPMTTVDSLPSQLFTVDVGNEDKQIYYKMRATDGNDIFIPISSLPEIGSQKIEILSFDVADVKPFSPTNNSTPDIHPHVKPFDAQALLSPPPVSSPHVLPNSSILSPPYVPTPTPSTVSSAPVPPSTSSLPLTSSQSSSTPRDNRGGGAKPPCTFLFSPKFNPILKHLPEAVGKASGKPPSPPTNKVKFLFKGFLKK